MRFDGATAAQLRALAATHRRDAVAPPETGGRQGWRRIPRPRLLVAALVPFRALALVGLTVLVATIVSRRGDVDTVVWLRLGVLVLLAWTVWTQLGAVVCRHRSSAPTGGRRAQVPTPVPASALRAVDSAGDRRLRRLAVRGRRRAATGLVSWWALVVAAVSVCAVFGVIVIRWMLRDLDERGLGPWTAVQVFLVGAAAAGIAWTMFTAARSRRSPSRRHRPHLQRFLNWLVRLLTFRTPAAAASPSVPAAAGPGTAAWALSAALAVSVAAAIVGIAEAREPGLRDISAAPDGFDASAEQLMIDPEPLRAGSADPLEPNQGVSGPPTPTPSGSAVADPPAELSKPPTASVTPPPTRTPLPGGGIAAPVTPGPIAPPAGTPGTPESPAATPWPESEQPARPDPAATPNPTATPTPTTPPRPAATASPRPAIPPRPTATASPRPAIPPRPTATASPTPTIPPRPTTTPTIPPRPTTTPTSTVTPSPTPCTVRGAPDRDCDGVSTADERDYGSDPANARSTPEGRTYDTVFGTRTCGDGRDNDGDGGIDLADFGCSGTID